MSSNAFNGTPRSADPLPPHESGDPAPPPHSRSVAQAEVYAHQSLYGGDDVLHVQIDAPDGVQVKVSINDADAYQATVGR